MTVGRYRWTIAALLFLANAINYLDRSALSIVAPLVSKDLGFDPARLGIVFSAFFVGYSIFCFVGGWAADRWGVDGIWWVISLTAAARGIAMIILWRAGGWKHKSV